ncbi:MAG: peptidase domain-containing ABC transporter [Chromatiaceae bacterium]|nr:peptidase domain-containing ABC transporter [Chromatiaceae bacterium]MCP5422780.1 peptidase domain-containing ABC transporter [Chromatiaceae bacterium]
MAAISLLNFPGRRRVPLILQNEASECGLACLAMIAGYHGHKTDLATIQRRNLGVGRGARMTDLMQIAGHLQLSARPVKLALDDLHLLQGPSILHWDFGHYVVLTKVGAGHVVIHDPASGERRLAFDEVSKHFTGVALELTPEAGFQPVEERRRVSVRELVGRVHGLPRALATVVLLALALEAFTLAAPLFMQLVVDGAVVSNDADLLSLLAIGFLLLGLIRVAVATLRGWVVMVLSNQLNLQLLGNLFRHLVRLPLVFFERRHLGDVVSRFDSMGTIQRTLTGSFLEAMVDGLMVITTLAMMLVYSAQLTAIVVGAAAVYAMLRLVLYRPLRQAQEEEIAKRAKQQSHFLETVRGMQSIKLFGRQLLRRAQFEDLLADQFNAGIRVQRLGLVYQAVNGTTFAIENIVVVWLAALAILDGRFSVGMLFAFVAYKQQFVSRATALVEKGIELKMLGLHGERVADIALSEPEPDQPGGQRLAGDGAVEIELRDVGFRYSDNEPHVLDGVSFHVAAGESVALVGPSGCGKTTLVKLMLGLLPCSEGQVRIGGIALDRLDRDALRAQVGTVMQDDQLFAGSIADNITFFDPAPDWEQVERCARFAAVHDEIAAMPLQYHTMVGDMGSVLSGGQKQRVLLARALYKRPRILVLDEATSHLDIDAERLVNDAVMQLPLTRVIVAHRPETIASADRVIALQRTTSRPRTTQAQHSAQATAQPQQGG